MDMSDMVLMDSEPSVKRMRKANYTDAEVRTLLEEVALQKSLLESTVYNNATNRRKQIAWHRIASKVSACGVATRTATELRDKWKGMKSRGAAKKNDDKGTGGQPQPAPKYEDVVISILKDRTAPDGQIPASLPVKSAQQPNTSSPQEDSVNSTNFTTLSNGDSGGETQNIDLQNSSCRQDTPPLALSDQKRNSFTTVCGLGTSLSNQDEDLFSEYMLNKIKESKMHQEKLRLQQEKLRLEVILLQRQVAEGGNWTVVQTQGTDDNNS